MEKIVAEDKLKRMQIIRAICTIALFIFVTSNGFGLQFYQNYTFKEPVIINNNIITLQQSWLWNSSLSDQDFLNHLDWIMETIFQNVIFKSEK